MRAYRPFKRLLVSVLVASLAAACSAAPLESPTSGAASRGPTPSPSPIVLTAYPVGFSTSYTDEVDPGAALLKPVPGGLSHDYTGTLTADDGTTGTYAATFLENRVPAAEITCGGLIYGNVFTLDAPITTFDVDFPDWGHAVLITTNRVVVYRSSRNGSSPAVCDEVTGGTYDFEFTEGPILQIKRGTWHWTGDGRLVFDEPAPASSPSESPS